MSLYEILGVDPKASPKEIKIAYRKLAAKHHPDREGGNEEKFKEIHRAYETLSNPQLREKYDRTGEISEDTTDYEASAKQTLSNVFDSAIINAIPVDLVKWCVAQINGSLAMVEEEIDKKKTELKRLKKLKGRMKVKKGSENIFESIVDSRITAINEYVNGLEKSKKISTMAIDMLEGTYEYVPEEQNYSYAYGLVQL